MPVTCSVTALSREHIGSAGEYLREVKAGHGESADLVAVAVDAGGTVAVDDVLNSVLEVSAADVAACSQLTGKAGQTASTVAKLGDKLLRVVFVGVGDRTASELRRAGGELARLVRPGEEAVADIVAARPVGPTFGQLSAFAEGLLLGSYRYTRKSADASAPAKSAEVRPACCRTACRRRGERRPALADASA